MVSFDFLYAVDSLLELSCVFVFDECDELADLLEILEGFLAGDVCLWESCCEGILRRVIEGNLENENVHFQIDELEEILVEFACHSHE